MLGQSRKMDILCINELLCFYIGINKMPFIASGTYGCIFGPSLECKEDVVKPQKTRFVSKVFSDDDNFKKERNIQMKIESIDPLHSFTIPYYGDCTVSKFKKSNSADKCEHIDTNTKYTYKQLLYQYGGKDFVKYMIVKKGSIASFKKLLIQFYPVITGLKVINEKGYVHLDIKPDNILYYKNQVYLIDFGLMSKKHEIFDMKHVLDHDYPFYPPEFKMYIHGKTSFNKFISRFLENFSYHYKVGSKTEDVYNILLNTIGYTKEDQEKDFISLVRLYYQSSKNITNFTDKIDVYSLGIVFALLYSWSKFNKVSNKAKKNAMINTLIKDMIKGMIRFDPEKRLSIKELCEKYDSLMKLLLKS